MNNNLVKEDIKEDLMSEQSHIFLNLLTFFFFHIHLGLFWVFAQILRILLQFRFINNSYFLFRLYNRLTLFSYSIIINGRFILFFG